MNNFLQPHDIAPLMNLSKGNRISMVQPKLLVNRPGDIYEQEADKMAEKMIQLQTAGNHIHEGGLGMGSSMLSPTIQKAANSSSEGTPVSESLQRSISKNKGNGVPLDKSTKNFMETAFSTDFSKVRVHTSPQASQLSEAINAKAFTYGNDIYFNQNQYLPSSREGLIILSHELTHVEQQKQVRSSEKINRIPQNENSSTGTGFEHIVKSGESLSLIAQEYYGDLMKWDLIYKSNLDQIKDPDLIEIGWKLFIPPLNIESGLAAGAIAGMDRVNESVSFSARCSLSMKEWEPIGNHNFRLRPYKSASEAVNKIFTKASSLDCAGAVWASLAFAILNTIGPYRFDIAFGQASNDNQDLVIGQNVTEGNLFELIQFPTPRSIKQLIPGDAVYFKNTEKFLSKHPGSPWQGENTIYRGNGIFSGFGIPYANAETILETLSEKYNEAPTQREMNDEDFDKSLQFDKVSNDGNEIPGIQWDTVMRLDSATIATW